MKEATQKVIEERVKDIVLHGNEYTFAEIYTIASLEEFDILDRKEVAEAIKEAKNKFGKQKSISSANGLMQKLLNGKRLSRQEEQELSGLAEELPRAEKGDVLEVYLATLAEIYRKLGRMLPVILESLQDQIGSHRHAVKYLNSVQRGLIPFEPDKVKAAKANLLKPADLIRLLEYIKTVSPNLLSDTDTDDNTISLDINISGLESDEDKN